MFTIIEGAMIVTRSKGVYRQSKIYEHNGKIFAQWSNGFMSIFKGAGNRITSSVPDVVIDEITGLDKTKFTKTGALVREDYEEIYQTADEVNTYLKGCKPK